MAGEIKALKVLQVIDRLDTGGAERVMVDLSNILNSHGHHVISLAILDHGPLGKYLEEGVERIDLKRKGRFHVASMKKLAKLARQHDIVHVHMRHNLKYVGLIKLLFGFHTPIIFHDHYGKINIDQQISSSLKWFLKKSTYIGVSNQLADWARQVVGLPEEKVYCLTNIILKQNINQTFPGFNGAINLIQVSNVRPEKNIEHSLAVIKELNDRIPASLTIYGKVVDKEYYQNLNELISTNKLNDQVQFVHDCSNLQPELFKYHIAIHSAASETGPLVLIEYLSQGLPFVVYRTGEVVNQIGNKVPGMIMDDFNVKHWAEKIQEVVTNPGNEQLISIYRDHYSSDKYYQKCLEIYQKSLTS